MGVQNAHIVADGGLGQLAKVVEDGEELLVPRHRGLGGRERLQRPCAGPELGTGGDLILARALQM